MLLDTALLPMLALILVRNLRPMTVAAKGAGGGKAGCRAVHCVRGLPAKRVATDLTTGNPMQGSSSRCRFALAGVQSQMQGTINKPSIANAPQRSSSRCRLLEGAQQSEARANTATAMLRTSQHRSIACTHRTAPAPGAAQLVRQTFQLKDANRNRDATTHRRAPAPGAACWMG